MICIKRIAMYRFNISDFRFAENVLGAGLGFWIRCSWILSGLGLTVTVLSMNFLWEILNLVLLSVVYFDMMVYNKRAAVTTDVVSLKCSLIAPDSHFEPRVIVLCCLY